MLIYYGERPIDTFLSFDAYRDIASRIFPYAELQRIMRMNGGVSADVHQLDLKLADGSATSIVLRSHGETHYGHPAELEFQLLQALRQSGLLIPEPLYVDVSGSFLADPFLALEFVEGSTEIPVAQLDRCIELMAETLLEIHAVPTKTLPILPTRIDPLYAVFDFLPEGPEWNDLKTYLASRYDTAYVQKPVLLHGDFWPGNLLWRDGSIVAILDWEDSALGDPLSDVACCLLELRYKFGRNGMQRFIQTYTKYQKVDLDRLALWEVYVAAAAQRYMGEWGLDTQLEAHMRTEALSSLLEAGQTLMNKVE